jgi:hypothetical protein
VGVIDGYLFVYLDSLGAPATMLGACLAMVCAAELPVFAFSGQILDVLGYSCALHVALGAFCLRLLAYSTLHLMPTVWLVLPVELLHGITFGISWSAGVNYCNAVAPKGLQSTIQSCFRAAYYGLGRGVGGLLGGALFLWYGGVVLFSSVLIGATSSWAAIVAAQILTHRTPR